MAVDLQSPPQPSVTSLVGGILTDVQDLVKQQVELTGKEIKRDINQSIAAVIPLAIAAATSVVGGFILCFMFAHLLAWAFPELPLWGGFGIVGGTLALIGLTCAFVAVHRLESLEALPESVRALKETFSWKTKQTSPK
jgi:hypothetical protein